MFGVLLQRRDVPEGVPPSPHLRRQGRPGPECLTRAPNITRVVQLFEQPSYPPECLTRAPNITRRLVLYYHSRALRFRVSQCLSRCWLLYYHPSSTAAPILRKSRNSPLQRGIYILAGTVSYYSSRSKGPPPKLCPPVSRNVHDGGPSDNIALRQGAPCPYRTRDEGGPGELRRMRRTRQGFHIFAI